MVKKFLRKHKWSLLYSFVAALLLLLAFQSRIVSSFIYDSDFARDITEIQQITHGHIRLTGPKLSFGGIFTGPYYYYLFTPALLLFPGQAEAMVYLNLSIFAVGIGVLVWILNNYQRNKKLPTGIILSLWIATTSYFLYALKNPGNAFSYLPLLAVLFAILPHLFKANKWLWWLVWGLTYGVVVNFHLVSAITYISLMGWWLITNYKEKGFWKNAVSSGLGFAASFTPLLIFEARHNFVMFKNTFIDKSYQIFTSNSNLPNPLTTSDNPLENAILMTGHFSGWTQTSYLMLIIVLVVLTAYVIYRKKLQFKSAAFVLTAGSLTAFVVFVLAATSQLAFHYFFPFILMVQVAIVLVIMQLKWQLQLATSLILLIINLAYLPTSMFNPSYRTIDSFRLASQQILADPAIEQQLRNDTFNLFVIRETPLAVLGWEYRYFLENRGLTPMGIQQYNQSDLLLIVDETENADVEHASSWELDQFGNRQEIVVKEIAGRKVYLFEKKHD